MTVIERTRPADVSEFSLRPSEVAAVAAGVVLTVVHVVRFAQAPDPWGWPLLVVLVAGLFATDFVTGFIHWVGDTWGTEQSFLFGPRFIKPFRFHHAHPLDMLKSNFFVTNGDNALVVLPFLIGPFVMPLDSDVWRHLAVVSWVVGAWGMWTSQFHLWAHTKHPPRLVGWLQRRGVILGPKHHWRHHKSPFATNYCISNGWCDPVLQRVRFFAGLEWVISRATGLRPRGELPASALRSPARSLG